MVAGDVPHERKAGGGNNSRPSSKLGKKPKMVMFSCIVPSITYCIPRGLLSSRSMRLRYHWVVSILLFEHENVAGKVSTILPVRGSVDCRQLYMITKKLLFNLLVITSSGGGGTVVGTVVGRTAVVGRAVGSAVGKSNNN